MKLYIILVILLFTSCVSNDLNRKKISQDNSVKINEQKLEYKKNEELKKEVEDLNEKIKKIEFEKLGMYIIRSPNTFTLRIDSNNLDTNSYDELFNTLIETMKYDLSTTTTISGNAKNVDFLKYYFLLKGIDKSRLKIDIIDLEKIDDLSKIDENINQLATTIIILKKNEKNKRN